MPKYNYNASNELTSNSSGSYGYDNNGNTLTDAQGRDFTWDFENRLVHAVVPGTNGGTTTFKYDPFGRRIQKSGPLGTTNYLYDGTSIVEDLDAVGDISARYTLGQHIDEPLAELRSGTTSFYQADGLGSVSTLTSTSASTAASYVYDSVGNLAVSTGSLSNPFQYTGRESDQETGLYYYRARYYNPTMGRFMSEDPAGFGGSGPNLYGYVHNSATNFVDPFGLADVYIWNYRGSTDAWGHASMDISNRGRTDHISWWPQDEGRDFTFSPPIPIYDAPAFPHQTLGDDIEFEGQNPDVRIHLDNLDEAAIAAWWARYRRNHKWSTFRQNCSAAIAHALEAGGGDNRVRNYPKPAIWTPEEVRKYALAIQEAGNGSYDYMERYSPHVGLNNK